MKIRIKEAKYGITALGQDLENWANTKGVNFKKLTSQKKPGSYGATISDIMYQIGNKYALIRYQTVAGAPRLNELKMWILDAPDPKATVLAGFPFIQDFGNIKVNLERIISSKGTESPSWNKASIEKLLRDLTVDKQSRNFNDAEAYETAQSILDDKPGLEDAIKNNYRVTDVVGWLADKM
jgi:hypothetical protein